MTTYAIANRGTRQDTRYARMREVFLHRHPYCALCHAGGPKVHLIMHHKQSWKSHPELRFKAENITILCEECHRTYHHFYSKVGQKEREKEKVN